MYILTIMNHKQSIKYHPVQVVYKLRVNIPEIDIFYENRKR